MISQRTNLSKRKEEYFGKLILNFSLEHTEIFEDKFKAVRKHLTVPISRTPEQRLSSPPFPSSLIFPSNDRSTRGNLRHFPKCSPIFSREKHRSSRRDLGPDRFPARWIRLGSKDRSGVLVLEKKIQVLHAPTIRSSIPSKGRVLRCLGIRCRVKI